MSFFGLMFAYGVAFHLYNEAIQFKRVDCDRSSAVSRHRVLCVGGWVGCKGVVGVTCCVHLVIEGSPGRKYADD